MSTVLDYIWLNECINFTSISAVLDKFYEPKNVLIASKEELLEVLSQSEVSNVLKKDYKRAKAITKLCFDKEIDIITLYDSNYPKNLRNIENPPLCLYLKGRMPNFDDYPVLGVVGTRLATGYGLSVTQKLCKNIAKRGGIVVSGMALGIDMVANQSALLGGGTTIAVLGCSVDICYPAKNKQLYEDIKATGTLISEYPPITEPHGRNFPQRNRIISGLSDGVIIVEAPAKSGALITASQALEQGKDIFAVPGNIDSINSVGTNNLIKEGAISVTSSLDIIKFYEEKFNKLKYLETMKMSEKNVTEKPPLKTLGKSQKPNIGKKPTISKPLYTLPKKRLNMTENESIIYELIACGIETPDVIIDKTKLSTPIVMSTITMLEIQGDITVNNSRYKIKEN